MLLYYPIEIDLYNIYPLKVITAQQNNIGRGAVITLKAAGVVIEPTGEEINLHAKKTDGTISYIPCTLSNGQIKVQFTNQMLALAGTVQVELQMISGSGADITDITTPIFQINVQSSNINEKEIESTNEFTALEQGLAEIEELKKNGLKGDAATIQVGKVTASEPGSNPQIKNVGTTTDAIFDFVLPRGVAGEEGPQGPAGKQSAYTLPRSQFPATGAEDTLYIDTSADPAMIYYWTGSEYKQAGGAGSGGGGSAAVVTFLRSGWTAGDSGYTQTMSVPGLTDAAEPQLQLPKNATAVQAAVWDSIKKSVPAAGNLTLTVDSQPGTDLDVIILSLPAQEGTAVGDIAALSQRITAAQADADALRTDVDEINANLNDMPIPVQPWHTDEIIIGTFNGKDLYEKCISIYGGNLTANSTKSIKHDIQIGDIISINKTCVYSNSHAFSDILWWEPGNTSEYLACNFTKTDIKLICAGSWSGDVKTYFKVQYTKA